MTELSELIQKFKTAAHIEIEERIGETAKYMKIAYPEEEFHVENLEDIIDELRGMTEWAVLSDATTLNNDLALRSALNILRLIEELIF